MKNIIKLLALPILSISIGVSASDTIQKEEHEVNDKIMLGNFLEEASHDHNTLVTLILNSCGWIIRNEPEAQHKKKVCLESLSLASKQKNVFADDFIVGVAIKRNIFPSDNLNADDLIRNGLKSSDERIIEAALPFVK